MGSRLTFASLSTQFTTTVVSCRPAELHTEESNGKKEVLSIEIKPEAVDPDDVEMLQDLVLAAVNEALRTAGDTMEREMSKLTGGLSMPGLF